MKKAKKGLEFHLFIMIDSSLQNVDLGADLTDFLDSLEVNYKFSEKAFDNSLLWTSARRMNIDKKDEEYTYTPELVLLYYNNAMFIQDYTKGKIRKDLTMLNEFYAKDPVKKMIIFQSVGDTLFNNTDVTRQMYDDFLIEVTVKFRMDYVELKTVTETYSYIRDLHHCLEKIPEKKKQATDELEANVRVGKIAKKACLEGFTDKLSNIWISFLMNIPMVSETKAIAIAKRYPTYKSLMEIYISEEISHKKKELLLTDVEIDTGMGEYDVNRKIGKKISKRIYYVMCSTDPNQKIDD
jgi:hypothetical protein